MSEENERAAQRAHGNARRPREDYDDEGRPASARARDADPGAGDGPADPDEPPERDRPDEEA